MPDNSKSTTSRWMTMGWGTFGAATTSSPQEEVLLYRLARHARQGRPKPPGQRLPDLAFKTLDSSGTALEQYIPLPLGNGPEWGRAWTAGMSTIWSERQAAQAQERLPDPVDGSLASAARRRGRGLGHQLVRWSLGLDQPVRTSRGSSISMRPNAPLEGRCSYGPGLSDCQPLPASTLAAPRAAARPGPFPARKNC